jgi:hypothetical protein
MLPQK